jgi:predicted nuclease with TOPRIM domain
MAFTVEDFSDLLRLLDERPEWRSRLRDALLPRELLELPMLVQQLVEEQRAAIVRLGLVESEVRALGARMARMEGDVSELKRDVSTLKSDVAELKTDVAELKSDMVVVKADVAELKTDVAELKSDMVVVKADVAELKSDMVVVKADVAELKSDMVEVKSSVARLEDGQARLESQYARLDERQGRLEHGQIRLETSVGELKGNDMELRVRGRLGEFVHLIDNPVAMSTDEVFSWLSQLFSQGHLDPSDPRRIGRTDIIVRGERIGVPTYLVVEVSWRVGTTDVLRARERAALLARAVPAMPVVAGRDIFDDARALAEQLGVSVVVEDELEPELASVDG